MTGEETEKDVRVLVVDDSAVVRKVLTAGLSAVHGVIVAGSAPDPYVARDMIVELKPDVLTLDIEMPRMDGVTFLKRLMVYYPLPVVVVSALTQQGCELTMDAFEAGAVDVVAKPSSYDLGSMIDELALKVKAAARARIRRRMVTHLPPPAVSKPDIAQSSIRLTNKLIAIGASTGGTEALVAVISKLPASTPGIVIVQHMPEKFTASFAERLNRCSRLIVTEAKDGASIVPGHALLAPGNTHLEIRRSGARYHAVVQHDPPVNHHRPSVDVLFSSVAKHAGANAVGVILTGMGADGSKGMLDMKKNGAYNIAQDEATSVVYGMPKEAVDAGAVDKILPIDKIADAILQQTATARV